MSIKVTTESWKFDCTKKHKGLYDYSLSVYKTGREMITIICPVHGEFSQQASSHRAGYGCKACANLRSGGTQRHSKEQFVSKAVVAHGDTYDYSLVEYKSSTIKVEIICKEHGSFWMTPSNHAKTNLKQGCPECAKTVRGNKKATTQEGFLSRAVARHGDLYDYSEAIYLGDKVKVKIGCKIHGFFDQVPSNHLQGQGCPKCKKCGYQVGKPGYLYVLSDDNVTKVGITNRAVNKRVEEVLRSGGPKLRIVETHYFEDGEIPLRIEGIVHKQLASQYSPIADVFSGSTECFYNVDLQALTDFIVPLASANNLAAHVEADNCSH